MKHKRVLQAALLMVSAMEPMQQNYLRDKTIMLHENYNSRNLAGTMSRHKAVMKCKKYCRPLKRK